MRSCSSGRRLRGCGWSDLDELVVGDEFDGRFERVADRGRQQHRNAERRVLELIRSGDFTKVEIEMRGGAIKTIRKSRRVDAESRIAALLDEHDFQRVTITKQDGKVVRPH